MSDIVKKVFSVLEVISSLNCKLKNKMDVCRKQKISDLEMVTFILTDEFISIDSEDSLFREIDKQQIHNLIERSQFNKSRRKLFFYRTSSELETITLKLLKVLKQEF